jgi:DNA phosphorothioation-dependent restriction protein DptF
MDMIQRLIDLRQSGTGAVVSEAGLTDMQRAMHVPDAIEGWIYDRVGAWRGAGRKRPLLVMLSGNAGDGKSDLIERLVNRLGDTADLSVIRDATHAEKPSDDQTALLAEFFAPFADDPGAGPEPRLSLIAMNTGMALSFFKTVRSAEYNESFETLESVAKRELGLAPSGATPDWDYEIINLDLRSVLPHDAKESLFTGMLDKLNPANADSILFEDASRCRNCCVQEWCFVHSNVLALQVPEVRTNLVEL